MIAKFESHCGSNYILYLCCDSINV